MLIWLLACSKPCEGTIEDHGITWVGHCGSSYVMGTDTGPESQQPAHNVAVPDVYIAKTETTVGQYASCVSEGACRATANADGSGPDACTWGKDTELPMTCVDFSMASDFCAWADAKLPSEAEWEFAARGQGEPIVYPWGEAEPTCDLAAINTDDCLPEGAIAVCSKPAGNSARGLCDMSGNAFEWVADYYKPTYESTPVKGGPVKKELEFNSMRGGGYNSAVSVKTRTRTFHPRDFFYSGMGFRCARRIP
jgi:formylglycine-generating enzyme